MTWQPRPLCVLASLLHDDTTWVGPLHPCAETSIASLCPSSVRPCNPGKIRAPSSLVPSILSNCHSLYTLPHQTQVNWKQSKLQKPHAHAECGYQQQGTFRHRRQPNHPLHPNPRQPRQSAAQLLYQQHPTCCCSSLYTPRTTCPPNTNTTPLLPQTKPPYQLQAPPHKSPHAPRPHVPPPSPPPSPPLPLPPPPAAAASLPIVRSTSRRMSSRIFASFALFSS